LTDTVIQFQRVRLGLSKVHLPDLVPWSGRARKKSRGDCLPKPFRLNLFQVKGYIAYVVRNFFSEAVRVVAFRLIAEYVEEVGLLTGFDEAVSAIGSQGKLDFIAGRRILD